VAPVGEVAALGKRASIGKEGKSLVHARLGLLALAPCLEVSHVEGEDLNENGEDVDGLASDEDEEAGVVARADAAVEPGAVVVVALHAPLAHVAVVTAR